MRAEEPSSETFGDLLRRHRSAIGLSQEELAERSGLSRRAISDLERGAHRRPYPATTRRLAEALHLAGADLAALLAARQPLGRSASWTRGIPRPAPRLVERSRLPNQPGTLIGRARELSEIQSQILQPEVHLVTLTGAGGSGKTRLALEAAQRLAGRFVGGAVFVDLSTLRDPAYLVPAIAGALGVGDSDDGQSLLSRIQHILASQSTLLVLDNFEHLLSATPDLAELLSTCPTLKVLATSRIALRLRWEHEFVVLPLALPEAAHLADIAAMERVPSVALFLDRARASCPDLLLSSDNAAAIAWICQRLDGLPLALELVAARTKLLSPQALAGRLDRRLPLLTDGPRDLPTRQRTLRAALDWSHDLLSPLEKRLFRRLSVFAGGGRLDQVVEVCRDPDEPDEQVLSSLASLVAQSLLYRDTLPNGDVRLRLLETIREFALEQLEDAGEADVIRRAHALVFLGLCESAEPKLFSPERMPTVEYLADEHDNLRAALVWMLDSGEAELGCRLIGALTWLWYPLGKVQEVRAWAERALSGVKGRGPSPGQAKALLTAGLLASFQGDADSARRRLKECLSMSRRLHDEVGIARAQIYLGGALAPSDSAKARVLQDRALAVFRQHGEVGWTALALQSSGRRAFAAGENASACALFEEALGLFRQMGDGMMAAEALNGLGDVARSTADYERAASLYGAALELLRKTGDRSSVPALLHNLGHVAQHQGKHLQAVGYFAEALALFRPNGDQRGIAECLAGVAGVAAATGQPERAARLFGAAEAALEAAGTAISPSNVQEYARNLTAARSRLGGNAFAAAWRAGRAMSLEEAFAAVEAVAEDLPRPRPPQHRQSAEPWLGLLTPREGEVAALVVRGLSNCEIASALVIAEQTVETHVKHLLHKLGLASRHQVQAWLERHEQQSG